MCQPPPEAGIPPLLTVVGRHGPDGRVVPHHDQKLSCTGQGRVQHPRTIRDGAAGMAASTTHWYSLPWALWTVMA